MKPEPLVTIGQGDNQRTITERQAVEGRGTPWLGLVSLWLAFAVLAWLWEMAKGGK
jgi:hypothetical protein